MLNFMFIYKISVIFHFILGIFIIFFFCPSLLCRKKKAQICGLYKIKGKNDDQKHNLK